MMQVRRLRDGAAGWAVQMAVPFAFLGVMYLSGDWLAEVGGERLPITNDEMRSLYIAWTEGVA